MADEQKADEAPQKADEAPRRAAAKRESGGGGGGPENRFTVARLTAESQAFFGKDPYILSGALHGMKSDELLTISDAEARVSAFLGR